MRNNMPTKKPISAIQKLEKDFAALKIQLSRLAKDLQEVRKAASKEVVKKVNKKTVAVKASIKKAEKKFIVKPIQKMAKKCSCKSKPTKKR